MSFDNVYANRKDWQAVCRRFSRSCRAHGDCPWCRDNRQYRYNRIQEGMDLEIEDFFNGRPTEIKRGD